MTEQQRLLIRSGARLDQAWCSLENSIRERPDLMLRLINACAAPDLQELTDWIKVEPNVGLLVARLAFLALEQAATNGLTHDTEQPR